MLYLLIWICGGVSAAGKFSGDIINGVQNKIQQDKEDKDIKRQTRKFRLVPPQQKHKQKNH